MLLLLVRFFDFCPVVFNGIRGVHIKVNLFPPQTEYNHTNPVQTDFP